MSVADVNRRSRAFPTEAKAVSGVFEAVGGGDDDQPGDLHGEMNMAAAQEFFRGKALGMMDDDSASESHALRRSSTMASLAATLGVTSSGGWNNDSALSIESPVERARRLRGELAEIRNFVQRFLESRNVKENAPLSAAAAEECYRFFGADHRELLRDLQNLEKLLQETTNSKGYKAIEAVTLAAAEPAAMTPASLPAVSAAEALDLLRARMVQENAASKDGEAGDDVTFTLYTNNGGGPHRGGVVGDQSNLLDSARLQELERRLADLEESLGVQRSSSRLWLPGQNVCETLQLVVSRLSTLHPAKLDVLTRRVNALGTQVDDLLFRRAKLANSSSSSSTDPNAVAELQRIATLYEFVERTRPAAAALPTVLARLRALRGLHQEAAALVSRLDALEAQQEQLAAALSCAEESLLKLRDTVAQNAVWARDVVAQLERQ